MILVEYHPRQPIIFSRDDLKQHDMWASSFDHGSLRYVLGDVRDPGPLGRAFSMTTVAHVAAIKAWRRPKLRRSTVPLRPQGAGIPVT
jgi:FlaA1/EpsC-like NDP-sugar epimerase